MAQQEQSLLSSYFLTLFIQLFDQPLCISFKNSNFTFAKHKIQLMLLVSRRTPNFMDAIQYGFIDLVFTSGLHFSNSSSFLQLCRAFRLPFDLIQAFTNQISFLHQKRSYSRKLTLPLKVNFVESFKQTPVLFPYSGVLN